MATIITSNGGGSTKPIEALFDRLASHPLDRTFEAFGGFIITNPTSPTGEPVHPGHTLFFGNFATYSHVFGIYSDDADLIDRLTAAIRANQARHDYLAQPPYFDGRKLEVREHRFSETQGEVELIYDGRRLGQYGETYSPGPTGWRGRPVQFWLDVARKVLADQHAADHAR